MDVKMKFQKERKIWENIGDAVVIELRGTPVLVETLKQLIVDYMKKQESFEKDY